MFYDPQIHKRVGEVVHEWLTLEWKNRSVNVLPRLYVPLKTRCSAEHPSRPYICTLIRHLRIHAQYNAHFESPYVNILSEYYTNQAKKRTRPCDDPLKFLDYCAVKTAEETARACAVLPDTSWNAVQATTERSLLLGHLDWLADGGERDSPFRFGPFRRTIPSVIGPLIEGGDAEKLRTLIAVFDRVGGVPKLVETFKSFVTVSPTVIGANRFAHPVIDQSRRYCVRRCQ